MKIYNNLRQYKEILRNRPNIWIQIAWYNNTSSIKTVSDLAKTGGIFGYPVETLTRYNPNAEMYELYARYRGDEK